MITRNTYGKGDVFYVGTVPSEKAIRILVKSAAEAAGIKPPASSSHPLVEITELESETKERYIYLINFSAENQEISLHTAAVDPFSQTPFEGTLLLPAMDYKLLKLR